METFLNISSFRNQISAMLAILPVTLTLFVVKEYTTLSPTMFLQRLNRFRLSFMIPSRRTLEAKGAAILKSVSQLETIL